MTKKKTTLKVTEEQLNAIVEMRNDVEAAIGGTEIDKYLKKQVRLVDNMLKANGYTQN